MKQRYIIFILISAVALIALSCEKEKYGCGFGDGDYLVFGDFFGECGGEGCVDIFRLDHQLTEDTRDFYPTSNEFYNGDFSIVLSEEKRAQVEDLWDLIPQSFLDEQDTVLGQPDAGDWGGVYFEIKTGSVHRFWLMDKMPSMPEAYNQFVERINERIELIQQ